MIRKIYYLRSEKDILKLVQTIIASTKNEGEKAGEDFWVKAEKLYYTALINGFSQLRRRSLRNKKPPAMRVRDKS